MSQIISFIFCYQYIFRYDFASYKVQRFSSAVLRDANTESGAEIRPGQHEHLLGSAQNF
jgi:hypothetical protein